MLYTVNIIGTILRVSFLIHLVQSYVPADQHIRLLPLTLKCNGITQSYPVTLLSQLFSSVPKRQYALQDIKFSLGKSYHHHDDDEEKIRRRNNFCLLVGRSASGKSSLLRIISGQEKPASGSVLLNDISLYPLSEDVGDSLKLPTPIIIDSKPDCFDDQHTVLQRIENSVNESIDDVQVRHCLALKFSKMLNLSETQLAGYSSSLSPSGQYQFGLACASVASCHLTIAQDLESSSNNEVVNVYPPIILLDELLDRETSIVAGKVGEGLANLAENGAIIICATHRQQYLLDYADRMLTLSGGALLKDEDLVN